MRKHRPLLFFLVIFFFFTVFTPVSTAKILFGRDYYDALHYFINRAEDSVLVAMYFIIITPDDSANPINQLVNDLIKAKKRGVKVKVILEDSKLKESRLAYRVLRENNIPVYFDRPGRLLHLKGIVIDEKIIFLGSANWSRAALFDNFEASYFDDSPQEVRAFKEYIDGIPYQKGDIFLPESEGITLPAEFLLSVPSGRILLKRDAFKQFDLYLLLLKKAQISGESSFKIDYDRLAEEMDYTPPEELGRYRSLHDYYYERIHRILKKLEKNKLIKYKKGVVNLKKPKETSEKPIIIPDEYWEYDYPQRLSLRAKYMYMISLYEAGRSSRYPFWFRSQQDMSSFFGISETTISLGLLELEEKGLIEVTRDKPTPPDFADRKANIYRLLPLSAE